MVGIIVEGVLFVALVLAAGTLLYSVVMRWTPLGRRLAQAQNRERIEEATSLSCPIHGPHEAHEMVRLPGGELICPQCYAEAMHAD